MANLHNWGDGVSERPMRRVPVEVPYETYHRSLQWSNLGVDFLVRITWQLTTAIDDLGILADRERPTSRWWQDSLEASVNLSFPRFSRRLLAFLCETFVTFSWHLSLVQYDFAHVLVVKSPSIIYFDRVWSASLLLRLASQTENEVILREAATCARRNSGKKVEVILKFWDKRGFLRKNMKNEAWSTPVFCRCFFTYTVYRFSGISEQVCAAKRAISFRCRISATSRQSQVKGETVKEIDSVIPSMELNLLFW